MGCGVRGLSSRSVAAPPIHRQGERPLAVDTPLRIRNVKGHSRTLAQPSSQPPGPPVRTIVWSATTMSSSLAIRLYSEGHCETKESPMRSVWVDLVTDDRRPLWPDSLKPC